GQFDDFTFKGELSDGAPPLGAGLQGGQQSEVLDLRELAGQSVNLQLTIRSEAFNTNVLGFYRVDNAQGNITDSFGNVFNPGHAGYLRAAVAQWAGQGSVSTSAGRSFSTTVAVEGGGIWVPFMITNGTLEQLLDSDTSNDPIVFTPFLGSNPGQGDYVRLLGDNTFGFEDMVGG
ncbi:MAG: bifunctional metallophosphatase/5'-nucleotidase, partial [Nodosilinea sp.]